MGRHAVPEAWPPPTKFRAEIWGVGQVVVPYGFAGDEGSGRRVVGPYGCGAGSAQRRGGRIGFDVSSHWGE